MRLIVLISLAGALAWIYRRAVIDHVQGDLSDWQAFVLIWLPASVVLGLALAYGWPRFLEWWHRR